jgi:hypothetical protein
MLASWADILDSRKLATSAMWTIGVTDAAGGPELVAVTAGRPELKDTLAK